MQQRQRSLSLVWVVSLVCLLAVSPTGGAISESAAASTTRITLSRYVVEPGTGLTVKGVGFRSGDPASVTLVAMAGGSMHQLANANAPIDSGGGFTASLTVPQGTVPGSYGVLAQDTHRDAAAQILQVPVRLRLKSGAPGPHILAIAGQPLDILGTGFKSGETVDLGATFQLYGGQNAKVMKAVTANAKGAIGPVTIQIPFSAKDGAEALTAVGQTSGKAGMVTTTLTVAHKAFLLLVPPQVTAGQNVTFEVGGFVPGAQVSVTMTITRVDTSSTTITRTLKVGGQGIAATTLVLPHDIQQGTYTISASDSLLHLHTFQRLRVMSSAPGLKTTSTPGATPSPNTTSTATPGHPAITVAPLSTIPGADVQVRGTGFTANVQVTSKAVVGRTDGSTQTLQATAKTDSSGIFTAMLHTPNDASAGTYAVTAKATGGQVAHGKLVIAALKTSVVVVPTQAVPGTNIIVHGFGFSSGATITVYLAGQKLGTAVANAGGGFKATLTVPASLATGAYTLTAQEKSGRKASIGLRVYRQIATHFYFASLYTGPGFLESLIFVNTSSIRATVRITYQRTTGAPRIVSFAVPAHSRLTHDVSRDLAAGVNASAVVSTDVPISAERMVVHGRDGSIDPGALSPSTIWHFANGNTSHQYQEYIAVQNPMNSSAQVTLQLQPTHSHTLYLHRLMPPQSRTTWHLNTYVHDAVGVIVTASGPIVANRTIFIHNGISSKTGVRSAHTRWYFAAGPPQQGTRHWIGLINTANTASYLTLHAYDAQGAEVATITRWLKPYARVGYLINKWTGQSEVAIVLSTTQPSIAEQSTFVAGNHDAHTESFGVTSPQKTVQFAEATTWQHQDNLLALFNPNVAPIPIVVQFLNAHGSTTEQTYIVAPLSHQVIDVGKVLPNSQLGLLAASSDPFVALDRQVINDGAGAMTTLGTQG